MGEIVENGKCYVGKAVDLDRRVNEHAIAINAKSAMQFIMQLRNMVQTRLMLNC